ncbi:ribonuclease E inhibitor RraB [Aliidiomarina taiwanensis]|uniref:Ribonuclease E inhibitor RraB n=1 Tax=Aliidiomarina taiwanensis TaxID=946228 RepID=A0A432WZX0_9GAMM|nr:ribonuclease E inhibitor RraB [Aliidiomarina taiwanensis]RUO39320.1 ribonuclease E inhibitor RraB [Aliidiomarina taiwanensis]
MSSNNLDELLQMNQDTISALLDDGVDAESEFEIEHHIVSTNFDKLEKAAVELVKAGYHVEDAEEFEAEDGQLCFYFAAVTRSPIDEEILTAQTQQVFDIAEAAGVEYDGWGTYFGDEESEEEAPLPH